MNEIYLNNNKLVTNWIIDTEQEFWLPKQPEQKPEFDNPVDDIIWTLEHENDPKPFDLKALQEEISEQIVKDIDKEIMDSLTNITKGNGK